MYHKGELNLNFKKDKYIMTYCSNINSQGINYLNQEPQRVCYYYNHFYYGSMVTSRVVNINKDNNEIIVQTKNTKYIFKKI